MFTIEDKKDFTIRFKIRATIEKLKIESIMKEMQENESNYSAQELQIFDELLQEANEDYNKYFESYSKGSIIFGIEELRQKYEKNSES